MGEQLFECRADEGGGRLDKFLAERPLGLSRAAIGRLIDDGHVAVNGRPVRASYKLRPGDRVTVDLPAAEPAVSMPETIPLAIVYEDDALLVIDKPAGMVVHPAPGHTGGTLVNALLAYVPELSGGEEGDDGGRPGIVHRLDRDTSGLIVVAKNEPVRQAMQRQFKARAVEKVYLALVDGHPEAVRGRIEAPVGRDPHHRQRMAVLAGGREATTDYRVVARFYVEMGPRAGRYALLEVEPRTGRTHQIRVHLASIGHPVAGDAVYGRRRAQRFVPRLFLHAWRLRFDHPVTGRPLALEAPLPEDLAAVLRALDEEGSRPES